jgi:hypothetical protein
MDRDLEEDLWRSDEFLHKIRTRNDYAQNVYAALCNMRWQAVDVVPILRDEYWSCSWRGAGDLVAKFRKTGDYMDWYCSGIQDFSGDHGDSRFNGGGYVEESTVTDEIREDFAKLGWVPTPWPKD